jgi:hypothetical protein
MICGTFLGKTLEPYRSDKGDLLKMARTSRDNTHAHRDPRFRHHPKGSQGRTCGSRGCRWQASHEALRRLDSCHARPAPILRADHLIPSVGYFHSVRVERNPGRGHRASKNGDRRLGLAARNYRWIAERCVGLSVASGDSTGPGSP